MDSACGPLPGAAGSSAGSVESQDDILYFKFVTEMLQGMRRREAAHLGNYVGALRKLGSRSGSL